MIFSAYYEMNLSVLARTGDTVDTQICLWQNAKQRYNEIKLQELDASRQYNVQNYNWFSSPKQRYCLENVQHIFIALLVIAWLNDVPVFYSACASYIHTYTHCQQFYLNKKKMKKRRSQIHWRKFRIINNKNVFHIREVHT